MSICAVIPTRYHPPELTRLLAVLEGDGVCTHLIVDPGHHEIYRMWNEGADAARADGADYIAVLNDDIRILPGTLAMLVRAFSVHESRRRRWECPLGISYPDLLAPWGSLPVNGPLLEVTKGDVSTPNGMLGFCFLFRAEIDVRFDESYLWWYGDNQFERDVRLAGWSVAKACGVPIIHHPDGSASKDWTRLAPIVAEDRRLWERRTWAERHPEVPA